ncbi:MAG: protein-L-isoaspartate(D-aspartate) O-methyltransferase [Bacteroidia bacterium]|nr:protein-L-isoaspartate(D-aspartate) O-methyltransferase [Bacteroidia bacterium]MDW8300966.1 protein-L-isoaspartate(D-aspartate) O-methyltransferase [Bacteroidia bacterium]
MPREDTYKLKGLRRQLVEELRRKGIQDERVLQAIENVPRHYFVTPGLEELCYQDQALPTLARQTISQPYTVAYQTQYLKVQKGDKVLEIGTGSGYQSVILAALGAKVYTIERIPILYEQAAALLSTFGMDIYCKLGDGTLGWAEHAPFDKIIVTAGSPDIPQNLVDQLKVDGLMIIPVGSKEVQVMTLVRKVSDKKIEVTHLDTFRFVPLLGEQGWTD